MSSTSAKKLRVSMWGCIRILSASGFVDPRQEPVNRYAWTKEEIEEP